MHKIGEGTILVQVLSSFEVNHTVGVDTNAAMMGKDENDGKACCWSKEVMKDFIYSRFC